MVLLWLESSTQDRKSRLVSAPGFVLRNRSLHSPSKDKQEKWKDQDSQQRMTILLFIIILLLGAEEAHVASVHKGFVFIFFPISDLCVLSKHWQWISLSLNCFLGRGADLPPLCAVCFTGWEANTEKTWEDQSHSSIRNNPVSESASCCLLAKRQVTWLGFPSVPWQWFLLHPSLKIFIRWCVFCI